MKWIKVIRSLYLIPRNCDVCGEMFDVGYAVVSDDGIRGDVCERCLESE